MTTEPIQAKDSTINKRILTEKTRWRFGEVPAFTEANRRDVDPDACACLIEDGEIIRCPLHGSAGDLLAALERLCKLDHGGPIKAGDIQRGCDAIAKAREA